MDNNGASATFDRYAAELADPARPLAVSKLVQLSNMGPDEASLLMSAWLAMDPRRRERLIAELIELAEDNVELNFDRVYVMALGDAEATVRRSAVQGLWEYDGRDLIDSLVGLLETDADASVRAEAALALGRFVLQAEFNVLRTADVERVDRVLRRAFEDEREHLEVRGRALESIGARTESWVRDLIERAYDSPERVLRLSAVHAMGRSCDAGWLPAILPELASDEAEMRFEAATALGSIADEDATPHLLPLLQDGDAEVREAAIAALGEIGGDDARRALQGLLDTDDERVRDAAIAALAEVDFADDPLAFKLRG